MEDKIRRLNVGIEDKLIRHIVGKCCVLFEITASEATCELINAYL
jgi:hypothetical protein